MILATNFCDREKPIHEMIRRKNIIEGFLFVLFAGSWKTESIWTCSRVSKTARTRIRAARRISPMEILRPNKWIGWKTKSRQSYAGHAFCKVHNNFSKYYWFLKELSFSSKLLWSSFMQLFNQIQSVKNFISKYPLLTLLLSFDRISSNFFCVYFDVSFC